MDANRWPLSLTNIGSNAHKGKAYVSHKITLARQILREYKATQGLFPSGHIPALREAAIKKYGDLIEREVTAQ